MKKLLNEYYRHVEKSFAKDTYSADMYELFFLSQLNMYALQFNPIVVGADNVEHSMSLISLVLAGSGTGKDSAIKFLNPLQIEVEKLCNKIFEKKREILLFNENNESDPGNGMDFVAAKPYKKRKKPLSESLATEHVMKAKSATDAGLNTYFVTYSLMGFGSVGLSSTEFGQDFQNKDFIKNLEKILEIWDSPSKSASRITNENGAIVFDGIQAGFSGHGAFDEFLKNDKMIESLQTYLTTTMGRRCLFFNLPKEKRLDFLEEMYKVNKKKEEEMMKEVLTEEERKGVMKTEETNEHIQNLIKKVYDNVLYKYGELFLNYNEFNSNGSLKKPEIKIRLSRGAEIILHRYKTTMNKKVLDIVKSGRVSDERLRIEIDSRHLKAMRIAGMSAFYNYRSVVSESDVKYGIKVVQKSGEYFEEISKPNVIVDDVCQYVMGTVDRVTVRDLEVAEVIPLNMAKYRLNDLFERCAEELYQNNKIFRSTMGQNNMIGQIWIENLIKTEGNIAKISYSTKEHESDAHMQTISVPIDKILDIPDIKKIGIGGFKDSSRSISNVQALGNVLIYDLDDGLMSIRQAQAALIGLTGFIYPTKNHEKEKSFNTGRKDSLGNDIIEKKKCARFRIVLLCQQHFPSGGDSNSEYKQLYKNVAQHFNIPFDTNTCDSSRFFWVPDNAKSDLVKRVGKIDGSKLLDLTYFIPELKAYHDIQSKSTILNSRKYWDNMSVREILERALKNEKIKGRNSALFSMAMNLLDKNVQENKIHDHIYDINGKFETPLQESEINRSILSSLSKRFNDKEKKNVNQVVKSTESLQAPSFKI